MVSEHQDQQGKKRRIALSERTDPSRQGQTGSRQQLAGAQSGSVVYLTAERISGARKMRIAYLPMSPFLRYCAAQGPGGGLRAMLP